MRMGELLETSSDIGIRRAFRQFAALLLAVAVRGHLIELLANSGKTRQLRTCPNDCRVDRNVRGTVSRCSGD
jgi:hypothetical protein